MNEIKEILDYLKRSDKNKFGFEQGKLIDYEETQLLLDYITNLQREKEKLKQTLHNITINGVEEENTTVLDLIKENERINQNNQSYQEEIARTWKIADDYKSRCEKANTYINEETKKIQEHQYSTGVRRLNKIQNILNGVMK